MRVAVLGLGNVLMGDDALGPHVIHALERGYAFPEGVAVRDLGTPGLDLIPYLCGLDALILVDTVHSEGGAGEIRLYREDQILQHAPQPRVSPHDPGVKEALLNCRFSGSGPREMLLVGVIPGATETGVGLTPAVRASIPQAVQEVVRELERLGVPPRPTALTEPGPAWWEREPELV